MGKLAYSRTNTSSEWNRFSFFIEQKYRYFSDLYRFPNPDYPTFASVFELFNIARWKQKK